MPCMAPCKLYVREKWASLGHEGLSEVGHEPLQRATRPGVLVLGQSCSYRNHAVVPRMDKNRDGQLSHSELRAMLSHSPRSHIESTGRRSFRNHGASGIEEKGLRIAMF